MTTKPEAIASTQAPRWVAPRLRKLGTMRDVAGSRCAPGNGASANGVATCPS